VVGDEEIAVIRIYRKDRIWNIDEMAAADEDARGSGFTAGVQSVVSVTKRQSFEAVIGGALAIDQPHGAAAVEHRITVSGGTQDDRFLGSRLLVKDVVGTVCFRVFGNVVDARVQQQHVARLSSGISGSQTNIVFCGRFTGRLGR